MRVYDEIGREKIRNFLKDCKVVYDLGCGEQKITEESIGVDLKEGADLIVDLNKHFNNVIAENIFRGADGFSLSHFLEHILSTKTFLKRCYKYLGEGGRIAVIVPDGECANTETLGDSEGTHEVLFTKKTLEIFLKHAGFKEVHVEYYERPSYKNIRGIYGCGIK